MDIYRQEHAMTPEDTQETMLASYDAYAAWTDSVAQYPPTAEPFYLALGIADEVGELRAKMHLLTNTTLLTGAYHDDVIKETGDCFWYISRYCVKVLKIPFRELIMDASLVKNNPSLSMIECLGTICGVEKKRIRDGELWDDFKRSSKNAEAYAALRMLTRSLLLTLVDLQVPLVKVLVINRDKLTARMNDGTIRGDGDNR